MVVCIAGGMSEKLNRMTWAGSRPTMTKSSSGSESSAVSWP